MFPLECCLQAPWPALRRGWLHALPSTALPAAARSAAQSAAAAALRGE